MQQRATIMVILTLVASAINYGSNIIFSHVLNPAGYGELTALFALSVVLAVPTAEPLLTLPVEAHRALLPIVQDQAAWVADLVSGRIAPPAGEDRRRRTAEFAQQRRRDFGDRHAFLVDHARYRAMLRRDRAAPAAAG